ncbi:MAG TPA: hypothetical protein VJL29_09545, partial [Thermoguttaceae bacterium]|nr:hypothetical protein [Thermoguttaceae bacterium]
RRGGAILAGWELAAAPCGGGSPSPEVTAQLSRMAVAHAARLAAAVPTADAAPARPLRRSAMWLGALVCLMAVLVVALPELARTEWSRFASPTDDVPPFSTIRFDVNPGDTDVLYGGDVEISAAVEGAAVEQVELALSREGEADETLPMFRRQDGRWQTVLSRVTAPTGYVLRAHGARTRRFAIRVITVPRIEDVRVRVTPPAYTRLAPYEGPLPREGLAGLPGTKVEILATSNRPLSGGKLTVRGGRAVGADDPGESVSSGPVELKMTPVASTHKQVLGEFLITGDGRFDVRVTDTAGQDSQESFAGTITCLADERPFVRLTRPETMSFATPTAELPVEISAEDDYGVARVELYRSLNDSRPMAMDVPLGPRATNQIDELVTLPLSLFGLAPGDVIKLFGRVEDNDPAGAKGAESPIVTVQIISQDDFERMIEMEEGIDVLTAKYEEAQRRIDSLAEELKKLQKEFDAAPPGDKETDKLREKMEKLVDRMRKESKALGELSKRRWPVDLDENLSPKMGEMARMTQRMAEELEKSLKKSDAGREAMKRQLDKMKKQLDQQKQEYEEQVTEPMEHLAAVFPLLVEQQEFAMLAMRQKDLAERLESLKDRDDEDDPAVRSRMRDLEDEQREIMADLEGLLRDIRRDAAKLPDDPRFDELRRTAVEFVDKVRASRAEEAMVEAESALAEFTGSRAHERAREASDLLNQFVKQCEGGMGQCAGNCLKFQPSLSSGLGNSIPQLMAMMGMGNGASGGMGMGGGGFSAQRGGYGMYGGLPGMGQAFGNQGRDRRDARSRRGGGRFSSGGRQSDNETLVDEAGRDEASGIGQGAVPAGSRRRVGQYFQRVNEETGDEAGR